MKNYSVFDIIGPIMIGPSSSHTAGAARIGYIAQSIVNEEFNEVIFELHGSFAKTYKGHGTDRALLAGVMGYTPDDERIKNAFEIASQEGLKYEFAEFDLGDVHPNTVRVKIKTKQGKVWEITGSSIGGGKAKIIRINDMDVEFSGEYTTILTTHTDYPGVVASVSAIISKNDINIAFMKLFRQAKGHKAMLIIETDQKVEPDVVEEIGKLENIEHVNVFYPV
jgi:L-serine dehydratase